jgi:hypothetical protein
LPCSLMRQGQTRSHAVVLLSGRRGALARESRAAVALAGVAEGLVEGAVGSLGRVGEDARDDELGFRRERFVGVVARGDLLTELVFEFFDALARGACGGGCRLELRYRHPAEGLVGRERAPRVDHSIHLLFSVFGTWHGKESFLCAGEAHRVRLCVACG